MLWMFGVGVAVTAFFTWCLLRAASEADRQCARLERHSDPEQQVSISRHW